MKISLRGKEYELYKNVWTKNNENFSSFIYSFVVGLLLSSSYIVVLIGIKKRLVPHLWYHFIFALVLSTVIIFLLRRNVKKFGKIFSLIFMFLLVGFYILKSSQNIGAGNFCEKNGGEWIRDEISRRTLLYTCVIKEDNYRNIHKMPYLYSDTRFEIIK